ncbi:hypothetical protein XAB3213_4900001 [Xanthomonas citri pv. bilvae]|nr:hypothetical protein XAB3213_4900001 [Xanthomonas citri pv. bilvae]
MISQEEMWGNLRVSFTLDVTRLASEANEVMPCK